MTQHAARWVGPTGASAGVSRTHRSTRNGHLGWKAQPPGRLARSGGSPEIAGSGCNFQVQYIRERRALPITRDYMAEAEARYRKIAVEPVPARKPRSAGRRSKELEPTGV